MTTTSTFFPAQTRASVPDRSNPALAKLEKAVGAIPTLAATMATSPTLIEAFVNLRESFYATSTFSPADRELILLTNAVENGCGYCTAIHTAFGLKEGVAQETITAVRAKGALANARESALVEFDRALLRHRGQVSDEDTTRFLAAGFTEAQALELIAAAAISTLANYSGRLTRVPLDEFLQPHAARTA